MNPKRWRGATHAEQVQTMCDALIRTTVADSDTLVILSESAYSRRHDLTVAHISAAGWVDLFMGRVHADIESENWLRHVSLTPSQVATLVAALQAHATRQEEN